MRPILAIQFAVLLALALGHPNATAVALGTPLAGAPPARAHDEPAAGVANVRAGPYRLEVRWYTDPPRTNQPLEVLIVPLDLPPEEASRLTVALVARPGLGTEATPTRGTVGPDPDRAGAFAAQVNLPVQGAWNLEISVSGPSGRGQARVELLVAAPGAIPLWLGWAIGLSPLLGLGAFLLWQRREVRRLLAEAREVA